MSGSSLPADYDGHNLVVLAGCPRSGTTWLQRLLAAHPSIRTGQESNLFNQHIGPQLKGWRQAADPQYRGGLGLACYFTEDEFVPVLKSFLLQLLEPMVAGLRPGEFFLEKSPANALFVPEIIELLPRARVIHVLRDARDTVSSLTSQEAWLSSWAPRNAAQAAHLWVRSVESVWDAVPQIPPGQFHEVRYEGLTNSPVEVLTGTSNFLGLDWDTAAIRAAVEKNLPANARAKGGTPIPVSGAVAKRSGSVVVEPEGFIRKAQVGSWKSDLSFYEKFSVWRVAHRTMAAAGYTWPQSMDRTFAAMYAAASAARKITRLRHRSRPR
jgi:hypothetical protein